MMPMCFVIFDRDVWDNASFKVYIVIRLKYVRGTKVPTTPPPRVRIYFSRGTKIDIGKKKNISSNFTKISL